MSCAEGRSCCLKQFQYLKRRDGSLTGSLENTAFCVVEDGINRT